MSTIETWDPEKDNENAARNEKIDAASLARLIDISANGQLDQIAQALSAEEVESFRHLMKHHKDNWLETAQTLSEEDVTHLVRFFTLAEAQLPGWEAGSLSPVIWLCRDLKRRGAFPNHDLIAWIKSNTDNKFLPYGNILDL